MPLEFLLSCLIYISIVLIVIAVITCTKFLGPKSTNKVKDTPYESGIKNFVGSPINHYNVRYYTIAIVFIVFDVEIAFMYPWAVNIIDLGITALYEVLLFLAILFFGLIYVYSKKLLRWT